MFIVRFLRLDGKPDEEYCYAKFEDARYHFQLFFNDDSYLYSKVLLLAENGSALGILTPAKRG